MVVVYACQCHPIAMFDGDDEDEYPFFSSVVIGPTLEFLLIKIPTHIGPVHHPRQSRLHHLQTHKLGAQELPH